jgi:ketol-acid reductoisomerase
MTKKDRITVLGYGSQGRAMALNLRDSGYKVIVGLRKSSKSNKLARKEKMITAPVADAIQGAGIIIVAIPDHAQQRVFGRLKLERLEKIPSLVFLHGSAIHFRLVKPPKDIPVLLLAPHAPGLAVRANYLDKKPFSAFYAVHQGRTKTGYDILIKLAKAVGIPRTHLIKTTFADEAVGDLFGEQAVLCGGLARLLKYGYETLVEAGLSPQNAYLEVAFQIDLIVELIKKYGLAGMFRRISPIARYGSMVNGPRVVPDSVKTNMKKVLAEIESGAFIRKADKGGMKLSKAQKAKLLNSAFDRQAMRFGDE